MRVCYHGGPAHEDLKANSQYWRTAVHAVLKKSKIPIDEMFLPHIVAFTGGQNPAFLVNGKFVVKFFSEVYSSINQWEKEIDISKVLEKHNTNPAVQFPKTLASGFLYRSDDPLLFQGVAEDKHWRWPWTIQRYMRGHSLEQLWSNMKEMQRVEAARYIGTSLRIIHDIYPEGTKFLQYNEPWGSFHDYIDFQYKNALLKEKKEGNLAAPLRRQIQYYLPSHPRDLYRELMDKPPPFLHGDFNCTHLIGKFMEDMSYKPKGVIDFGDSLVGDPLYDLVTIHIDVFKCNKQYTLELMKSYGIDLWKREDFAYKMMCYTLLHREDPFRSIYEKHPEWKEIPTLFELESVLYRIDETEASDYEARLDLRMAEFNRKLAAKRQDRVDKHKRDEKLKNYDRIFSQLPMAPSFPATTVFPNSNAHQYTANNAHVNVVPPPQQQHASIPIIQQPEEEMPSNELQLLQQRLQHKLLEELSKSQEVEDMEIIFREEKLQDEKPDYIIYDSDIDDITSNDDDSHIGYEGDDNEDEKADGGEKGDVVITSPLLADVIFFDDDDNSEDEDGEDQVVPIERKNGETGPPERETVVEYSSGESSEEGILRLSQPFQS